MANIIIDNGQYMMKYGTDNDVEAKFVPNCVIRTNDKRYHLGTDLLDNKKLAHLPTLSGLSFHRPQQQGQCYQWNLEQQIWDNAFVINGDDSGNGDFLMNNNLLYLSSVITIPKFQNMVDQVMFEEYGVGNYVRSSSSAMVPWMDEKNSKSNTFKPFQLVVDFGFDCTWVTPMIHGLPYFKGIKRMPIGGKMLNGYLREVISFRHYNVVEEPILVESIKRNTCYVATDYDLSIDKLTKLKRRGINFGNDMFVKFIMPDYKEDFHGKVVAGSVASSGGEEQSIILSDERFLIPEMMFHPQLSGIYKSGLISTIKESLLAVPELIRPLLTNNLVISGGNGNLRGLKERIIKDLDQEVPEEAKVRVCEYETFDLSEMGFKSGQSFFKKGGFDSVKVSKEEYFEFGCEYVEDKFRFKR